MRWPKVWRVQWVNEAGEKMKDHIVEHLKDGAFNANELDGINFLSF